jgi:signal transduction histidine kinase
MKQSPRPNLIAVLWVVILGVFPGSISGQTKNDSLMATFAGIKDDSTRIDSMLKQGFELSFYDPLLTVWLCEQVAADPYTQSHFKFRLGTLNLAGVAYTHLNMDALAMGKFTEMLRIADSMGTDFGKSSAWNNIGNIQSAVGNHEEALKTYRNARALFLAKNNKENALLAWTNIAQSHLDLQQYELAIKVCDSALLAVEDTLDTSSLEAIYSALGGAYSELKDYKKAIHYINMAIEISVTAGRKYYEALLLLNRANAYRQINELDSAEADAQRALQINLELGATETVVSSYGELAAIAKAKGDPGSALAWMEKGKALSDSLQKDESDAALANYQALYSVNQKDAEIALLNKGKDLQAANLRNVWYLFGLVSVVLLAALVILVVLVRSNQARRRVNEELHRKNAQVLAQHAQITEQNTTLSDRNDELKALNHEMAGILHVVAHDLKAPLSQLNGLLAVFEDDSPLSPTQTKVIGMAKKVTANASNLVNDLLELGGAEQQTASLPQVSVAMKALIADVVSTFAHTAARKSIAIETSLPEEDITCMTAPNHLRRVLENLVSNALKFSPQQTQVTLSLAKEGETVCITVADQGPGISTEDQKHLYRKFHRLTARPTHGESSSGLGLAIVKTLVEQLGGTITLHSELGKGARFEVRIPA